MDTFSGYHPLINFIYFLLMIGIPMFYLHPVLLMIGILGAMAYVILLKGRKAVRIFLLMVLPACLLPAILNPLFSHEGATMLFYLKNGNPVTLESIVYGIGAGGMLACVLLWFYCFQEVITADKLMYLFGKTVPAFSLLLSMALRFVPKYSEQVKRVAQAQQCVGRNVTNGSVRERAAHGLRILSITTTWALENSVVTADSMKSRGYGLRGRTNYSIYRFDRRDSLLLGFLLLTGAGVLAALVSRRVSILYFPVFRMNDLSGTALVSYVVYALLAFLPVMLRGKEAIQWHYLRSGI